MHPTFEIIKRNKELQKRSHKKYVKFVFAPLLFIISIAFAINQITFNAPILQTLNKGDIKTETVESISFYILIVSIILLFIAAIIYFIHKSYEKQNLLKKYYYRRIIRKLIEIQVNSESVHDIWKVGNEINGEGFI